MAPEFMNVIFMPTVQYSMAMSWGNINILARGVK